MTKNSRQVSDGQVLIRTHAERKDKELAGLSSKSSRFRILRFASAIDLLMLIAAITASVINGVLVPIFSIIFGNLVNAFGNSSNLSDKVNENALYLVYLAIAALIAGYVEVGFLAWMGFRQARSLRCAFVSSVMQQDIAWFDCHGGTNKLIQGLNEDSAAYESAISNRLGHFIRNITTCIAGLIVAFSRGWSMTLVILSTLPLLIGVGIGISVVTTRLQRMISRANQKSNGNALAQEALLNIRTLCSYNLQQQIVDRFGDCLEEPIRAGVKQGLLSGLTIGATAGVFSCSYALAIWYGSRQVADGNYDGGKVINILFAGVMAGFSLGQALPNIRFLQAGQVAFSSMCEIIDREPPIESNTEKGTVLDELNGDIEFEDVTFSYPIRPDRTVFQDFNLVIPAGTSVALVGPSGSGKSTIIQLLERFYDPVKGRILVDGYNLMDLNLEWWRTQVSLVSQEPTLFNLTIYENIAMAKPGCSMEEVMSAATSANAHAFITKLPDGYTTSVGAQGLQLSGGQRQRIAIARAILRNPHILLLDEATSALDNQSEKAVQESLEKLMAYRTTVIIAHRLTTVVNADNIAIVSNGQVIDQGTHRELLSREGFYSNLVSKQAFDTMEEDDEEQEVALTRKTTKKQVELRKSVLTRSSVRLSVIPQDIMNRLRKRKQENEEELKPVNLKRLLVLNKPEWRFGILGIIASACFGLQTPAFSIALSYVVNIFFKPTAEEIRSGGEKWAGIYVAIGVGCLLAGMVQGWAFAIMGQRLAARIKLMFIAAVLRQDVGWHDLPEHGTGKMMNSLIKDTMSIRGAIGDQAGVLVQNLATLIASLTIAFTASWKLTLVILSVLPLLLIAQFVQVLMITGQFKNEEDSESTSCGMALEGVRNIKIVNAYNVQGHISRNFAAAIPVREAKRSAHIAGIAYGFSQFVLYNVICLAFWYGSKIVLKGQLDFQELMMAFCALFFATFSIAQANVQFPDIGKAQESAKAVFGIIDNKPKIDIYAQGGARLPMVNGDIELENVTFAYPNRPDRLVLKHFSLKIPAGSSCALVGESGHGKSTIVGLVERFYDAIGGKVLLDGIDITKLNLRWLRNQIGVVSQEPVLFRGSIMENIALGNLEATTADVIEAAKYAYAYDFINALPEQFETKVGDGGVQLSGGQKQRIAIARAILKNPKVLLLDEATSALDAESEEIVQAALDEIMVGRTSIIIAHRLNTIRNVDKIAAIYRGRVLEEGTHEDLMQLDRYYAYLVKTSQM